MVAELSSAQMRRFSLHFSTEKWVVRELAVLEDTFVDLWDLAGAFRQEGSLLRKVMLRKN